jgi:phosphoglycerate dehydrogenase-like enzyme
MKPQVLFLTDRGERHQKVALSFAPPEIEVIMRRRPTMDELMDILPNIEYIISERSEVVDSEMINAAPHLKLIARLGSMLVGIDENAARARQVAIALQPVVGSVYVAEHILMMTLAVMKRLGRSLWQATTADHGMPAEKGNEDVFAFNWLNLKDLDGLYGKTVGILGMGEIGVEFARRVQGFAPAAVLYNKRNQYPESAEVALKITYASAEEIISTSDVLISLLPYSRETAYSIDAATFAAMKRGSYLVHAGSGAIIVESALIDALKSGKLAGASLDTYEYEPLQPDDPLVVLARDPRANLLLTPHTGAASSLPDTRAEDYSEIVRMINGEPLKYVQSYL